MGIHASVLEIAWTIPAVGAALFRGFGIVTAVEDYFTVRSHEVPAVVLLSKMRIREEVIGFVVNGLFASVGFYAFTQPDPPEPTAGQWILTGVFISAITLLFVNAVLRIRERQVLREHLEDQP